MNSESLAITLETGMATFWSRSRNELWVKGATSGHFQHVQSVALDCDGDALLVQVTQIGVACTLLIVLIPFYMRQQRKIMD